MLLLSIVALLYLCFLVIMKLLSCIMTTDIFLFRRSPSSRHADDRSRPNRDREEVYRDRLTLDRRSPDRHRRRSPDRRRNREHDRTPDRHRPMTPDRNRSVFLLSLCCIFKLRALSAELCPEMHIW